MRNKRILINVTEELHKKIRKRANNDDMSISMYIRRLIHKDLRTHD